MTELAGSALNLSTSPSDTASPKGASELISNNSKSSNSNKSKSNNNNNSNDSSNSSNNAGNTSTTDEPPSSWKALSEAEVPAYLAQFGVSVINAIEWPSTPPEIALQVSGRSTSGSHTVYAIECSYRGSSSSSRPSRESVEADNSYNWSAPRRLTEFRSILHDPVCKALGSSYHTYFCGVPFAARMRPAGTTARLDAWCKRLGYCISHKLVPPHIAAEVLRFVEASVPGSKASTSRPAEHVNDAGSTCTGGESSREAAEEEEDPHGNFQTNSAPSSPGARQALHPQPASHNKASSSGYPTSKPNNNSNNNNSNNSNNNNAAYATASPPLAPSVPEAAATAAAPMSAWTAGAAATTAAATTASTTAAATAETVTVETVQTIERGDIDNISSSDDDDIDEVDLPGL